MRGLHMAFHGCRLWTAVLCGSWIKPLCAREISGSPFASGQHFGGPYKNRENSLQFYGSWANGCGTHSWTIVAYCFAHQSWSLKIHLSSDPISCPPCIWNSLGLFWIYLKSFYFFQVKFCFCIQVLVWPLCLILRSDYLTKASELLTYSFGNRVGSLLLNATSFLAFSLFLWRDCYLETG